VAGPRLCAGLRGFVSGLPAPRRGGARAARCALPGRVPDAPRLDRRLRAPEDRAELEPSYERALFADLHTLLRAVPHEHIAVQWDVAVEFGMLELPEVWGPQNFDALAGRLARCLEQVPRDVPAGAHLCYGDAGHRHFKQPESLALQVRMMNAVSERARRPVSWFSITVPQAARDAAYFSPLADLRVDVATEIYFALVPYHPSEQPAGTTEVQTGLIDERLRGREWGICIECGMGRVDREDVLRMLDSYREILSRFGQSASLTPPPPGANRAELPGVGEPTALSHPQPPAPGGAGAWALRVRAASTTGESADATCAGVRNSDSVRTDADVRRRPVPVAEHKNNYQESAC
jgi:hypothetical protein